MEYELDQAAIRRRLFDVVVEDLTSEEPDFRDRSAGIESVYSAKQENGLPTVNMRLGVEVRVQNLECKVRQIDEQQLVLGQVVGELQRFVAQLRPQIKGGANFV